MPKQTNWTILCGCGYAELRDTVLCGVNMKRKLVSTCSFIFKMRFPDLQDHASGVRFIEILVNLDVVLRFLIFVCGILTLFSVVLKSLNPPLPTFKALFELNEKPKAFV